MILLDTDHLLLLQAHEAPAASVLQRIGNANGIFVPAPRERAPWSPPAPSASAHAPPTAPLAVYRISNAVIMIPHSQ